MNPEDIQSLIKIYPFIERNQRMLNLFLRKTHGISTLLIGLLMVQAVLIFQDLRKYLKKIVIFTVANLIKYEEFYRFNNLIHLNSLEKQKKLI